MNEIASALWEIIAANEKEEVLQWLKPLAQRRPMEIMTAFVAVPRQVSKLQVFTPEPAAAGLSSLSEGFSVNGWSLTRLSRVWLLTLLDQNDREEYVHHIRTLFDTAEMNELVALYSALPLLGYPNQWLGLATDAVRSNIGLVLDAIALQNPYPALHFPEGAWNQLIMKVIFNDKPIHRVYGLEKRANADLARILLDFAHERRAAGRQVAPQVWRLISGFVKDSTLADLKFLMDSGKPEERQAAALVCLQSDYPPAMELLEQYPDLTEMAREGKLRWKNLEFDEMNTYVS